MERKNEKSVSRYIEHTSGYQWERAVEREARGVGGVRSTTTMYKINNIHGIYCATQGIKPIFYYKYKWSITFKS